MEFVKYLKEQRPGKRLAIFGDGASYHNSQEFRELLKLINQEKPEEKWWINCLKFALNAPEQNPVEDIWLQTKNFMIAFYHLCSSFKIVKWLFKFFADGQIFDFPKLFQYGILPQPPRELLYMLAYKNRYSRDIAKSSFLTNSGSFFPFMTYFL